MSQHDYDLANQAGAAFRADLNLVLLAIASMNSGASAPATTFAYMMWADTGNDLLKQRNAANSAWVSLLTLSTGLVANAAQLLGATWAAPPALGFGSTTPRPVAATTGSFLGVLLAFAGLNSDKANLPAVATATPTHMFNANSSGLGWFLVGASGRNAGAGYASFRFVNFDGTTVNDGGGFNGASSAITVSGTSVRYTQSSGSPMSVDWFYLLLGNG